MKKLLGTVLLLSFLAMAGGAALAQAEVSIPSPPPPPEFSPVVSPLVTELPKVKVKVKKIDTACMQTAVEKRDTAIIAGLDAYYTATKTALSARKEALKTAWGITERKARKEALKSAWKDFKTASEKARKDFRLAKKSVWDQFNKDRKACGPGHIDEPASQSADNQL